MRETAAQKLLHILEAERQAIISADFEAVRNLETEKLNCFSKDLLEKTSPEQALVIKDVLSLNQALLGAAMRGVKQARKRISLLQEVSNGLRVYDKNGQLAQINNDKTGLDRQS